MTFLNSTKMASSGSFSNLGSFLEQSLTTHSRKRERESLYLASLQGWKIGIEAEKLMTIPFLRDQALIIPLYGVSLFVGIPLS